MGRRPSGTRARRPPERSLSGPRRRSTGSMCPSPWRVRRECLGGTGLGLFMALASLLLLPARAGAVTLSPPPRSPAHVSPPPRLPFSVANTSANEGLSRLVLRFPSGYRVTGGSAPPGWTVEPGPAGSTGEGGEITFRTTDEVKCVDAMGPGASRIFDVEVIAPASRSVTPDNLAGAQGEQSCRGVILDAPATLPSWDRLGIEAALAAGPPMVGIGADVGVTMTVTNLSTVELTNVAALLSSTGTGSVSQLAGPAPGSLTLAPGAAGSLTWAGREASLPVTPEQVASGQSVEVRMTVTNRGPVAVANVTPSPLSFEGTATASAAAGPSPGPLTLEPGASTVFTWAATISGGPGETYAFSGWASAEGGGIVSASATSNSGALVQGQVASEPAAGVEGSVAGGGGVAGGARGWPAESGDPAAA